MFSKALFKQSMKANWVKWLTVTVATCVMLAIVIIVLGNLGINDIRDSLKQVFSNAETQSMVQEQAIDGYTLSKGSLDLDHSLESNEMLIEDNANLIKMFFWNGVTQDYDTAVEEFTTTNEREPNEEEKKVIRAEVSPTVAESFKSFFSNPALGFNMTMTDEQIAVFADCFLQAYDADHTQATTDNPDREFVVWLKDVFRNTYTRFIYTETYTTYYNQTLAEEQEKEDYNEADAILLATQTAQSQAEGAQEIVELSFARYASPEEDDDFAHLDLVATDVINNYMYDRAYNELLPTDREPTEDERNEANVNATAVKVMSNSAITSYLYYIDEGYTEEDARKEASASITDQIPENVAEALNELGNMDIYGLIIGSIFYQIAGLLLPMVFVIMTANGLIAGQVDSGSMAYVLSTPTKRRTVTVTQMTYLLLSLFAMFALLTVVSVISVWVVGGNAFAINFTEILLLNLGAFLTMFAFAGICFMCSALFNRTKYSMSIGGGFTIFSLVCTILGLFGSSVVPSAMRISQMNFFNYLSIISFYDVTSVLSGTMAYLWKYAILLGIGIVTIIMGVFRFDKKDLPL